MAKKIGIFFIFALAVIGSLALLAYLIIHKAWALIPCLLAVCALAYPKARQLYKYITSGDE